MEAQFAAADLARPVDLPALSTGGEFRARHREPVADVTGRTVAELSLVPELLVNRNLALLRRTPALPDDERAAALAAAAGLFATGTLGGQSAAEYAQLASLAGGVPVTVVRTAAASVAARLARAHHNAHQARPARAVTDLRDPGTRSGRALWARRGDVFAVQAAGNHPGAHSLWPEALALGYRVAVRPSRREPFTAHRLVTALRQAGFGNDQVVLLPTGHDQADARLRRADLGMVYGTAEVVARYAADRRILVQGPGRSKILLTADADWHEHLDMIVDSVAGHAGTGCVSTTAVLIEGDPAPLCTALSERLAALPSLRPGDEKAVLPVRPAATAHAIAAFLRRAAAGTRPWLGAENVVDELGDGSAVLRPAVHQLNRPEAAQDCVELPFPCVWVAPWTREADLAPLRNSLVLTAVTGDGRLAERLAAEPTISNVYLGSHPTHWMGPGLPHDGYLAEFLMRSKTVIAN
jgi:acyl-CoA reductase-like NAD-dependent aldehyde dehydrogenase